MAAEAGQDSAAVFVPFTAQTRMSGVDLPGGEIRKGAVDAIEDYVIRHGGALGAGVRASVGEVARAGATPLVVAKGGQTLGVLGEPRVNVLRLNLALSEEQ